MTDATLPVGEPLPQWSPPPPPPRQMLSGRHCRLQPLDAERHAAGLFEANRQDRDHAMWTYMGYGPFATLAAYRAWMDDFCQGDDPLFYAIVGAGSRQASGLASYLRIMPAAGCIEIGHLAFSPLLRRQPAATEAIFLMLQQVFALGYRRCEWKCDALNARSRRAAQRLGFSFEGVFRQATVYRARNRDTAWYSVIDREWPRLREVFQRWLTPHNFDSRGIQRQSLSTLTEPLLANAF